MEIKKITPEMYLSLKKALPSDAVSKHPTKVYLSSIKAIFVTERLNDVFGCGSWQIRTEKIVDGEKGMVVVKVTLTIPEYGVYYESFGGNDNGGETSKNFDLGDAYKGATTDGITKIGSYLGIGISVFKGQGNITPDQPKPAPAQPKPAPAPVSVPTPALSPELDKLLVQTLATLDGVETVTVLETIWKELPELQKVKVFIDAVKAAKLRIAKKV